MNETSNISPVSNSRISEISEISGRDVVDVARMVNRGAKIMEAADNAPDNPSRGPSPSPIL